MMRSGQLEDQEGYEMITLRWILERRGCEDRWCMVLSQDCVQ